MTAYFAVATAKIRIQNKVQFRLKGKKLQIGMYCKKIQYQNAVSAASSLSSTRVEVEKYYESGINCPRVVSDFVSHFVSYFVGRFLFIPT